MLSVGCNHTYHIPDTRLKGGRGSWQLTAVSAVKSAIFSRISPGTNKIQRLFREIGTLSQWSRPPSSRSLNDVSCLFHCACVMSVNLPPAKRQSEDIVWRNRGISKCIIPTTSSIYFDLCSTILFPPTTRMFQTIIVASLAASAVAFRPAVMARPALTKVSMSAEGLAGQTSPLGFFDPLGLSAGKTDGEVKVRPALRISSCDEKPSVII